MIGLSTAFCLEKYLRDLADAMRSGTMPGTVEFAKVVAKHDFEVSS